MSTFTNSVSKKILALRPCIKNQQLNPYFVSGFVDAEGSFVISIIRKSKGIKWAVRARFNIALHSKDLPLLRSIQTFFGGIGSIYESKDGKSVSFVVCKSEDLTTVIIPHFLKYPLVTQKWGDFLTFKWIIELMNKKEHLTEEGLCKIVSIRAALNRGLSEELKIAFPNIIPVERPVVKITENLDPNWLVGFIDGCFAVEITKSKLYNVGFVVSLKFIIAQDSRDQVLMNSLVNYFGCGILKVSLKTSMLYFTVHKFADLRDKIIPFINKYPLQGSKILNFVDFCKVAELMNNKAHLTKDGLEEIRKIRSGMNNGRIE